VAEGGVPAAAAGATDVTDVSAVRGTEVIHCDSPYKLYEDTQWIYPVLPCEIRTVDAWCILQGGS